MKTTIFNQKLLKKKYDNEVDLSNDRFKKNYESRREILFKWSELIENKLINKLNETQLKVDFVNDILCYVLGYRSITNTKNKDEWTLLSEEKTDADSTKADVVLGYFTEDTRDFRVAIELKGPKCNLDSKQNRKNDNRTPVEQGFSYLPKYRKKCKWLIVSNYKEIRLYSSADATEYELFMLKDLAKDDDEFKRFLYILSSKSLINKNSKSRVDLLWEENIKEQKKIESDFYDLYKQTRTSLFNDILKHNSDFDAKVILKKTQKLLDRFIFICFAEDKGLIPENTFSIANEIGKRSFSRNGVWEQIKGLCESIDKGNEDQGINQFNGGLFSNDDILDSLNIPNKCFEEMESLSRYDFGSDLNENILGHIFEQSLTDLEEMKSQIDGIEFDNKKGKRKKDGIFYTPKYITKYIVENTIGSYLEKKRIELGEHRLPELSQDDYNVKISKRGQFKKTYTSNMQKHIDFYTEYKNVIANLKVLDPACGSGAFLNEAFDYLKKIGKDANEKLAELTDEYTFFDLNEEILKNNLYGVDLNEESIEITRLSLWLKTANKYSPLTSLDNNIKVGNSLIDNKDIAPNDFFDWDKEFPEVMKTGGFDVIIGNPPYVSTKSILETHREYYWSKYKELLISEIDLYELFLYEFLKRKLKKGGLLGYITPNTYYTNKSFSNLREYILNRCNIKTIIDFPYRYFPFEDVNKETAIVIIENENKNDYEINLISVDKESMMNLKIFNLQTYTHNSVVLKSNIEKYLGSKIVIKFNDTISKILNKSNKLGDYLELHKGWMSVPNKTICNGIEYKSKILSTEDINKNPSLKEIMAPCLEGKDIHRYYLDKVDKWVNIKAMDSKTLGWHNAPKIITQRIVGQNKTKIVTTIDLENRIIFPNANLINLKKQDDNIMMYLPIINSKLVNYFYNNFYGESNTNITKDAFESIPTPSLELNEPDRELLITCGKEILNLNELNINLIDKFLKNIDRNYNLKDFKISTIKKFYELDYSDFLNKLQKKNKLNLIQQEELEEYFDNYKTEINKNKKKINDIEKIINQFVYKIYNLDELDIKNIEKNSL